jgi:hypothetical protein
VLVRESYTAPIGPYDPKTLTVVVVGWRSNFELSNTNAYFLIKLLVPLKKCSQIESVRLTDDLPNRISA